MGVQKKAERASAKPKEHNTYIDVLKGFAILTVVFGHSLQTFVPNGQFDSNVLFRVIYSFHMPFFMFLSGAAASYSSRPMNFIFIKRKFIQLVIPFGVWYLLGYLLSSRWHTVLIESYLKAGIVSPDNGLWFLLVLFLNFICLAVARWLFTYWGYVSYAVIWLTVYSVPTGKYGIGLVKWHLPFFLAGYLVYLHRYELRRYRRYILMIAALVFPLLALTWHRTYLPWIITSMPGRLMHRGLLVIAIGDLANIHVYQMIINAYSYAVGFSGIFFWYGFWRLRFTSFAHRFLQYVGMFTLDIYVSHVYFFRWAFGPFPIKVISATILGLAGSWFLGRFILRKQPVLSMLLLGGRG